MNGLEFKIVINEIEDFDGKVKYKVGLESDLHYIEGFTLKELLEKFEILLEDINK